MLKYGCITVTHPNRIKITILDKVLVIVIKKKKQIKTKAVDLNNILGTLIVVIKYSVNVHADTGAILLLCFRLYYFTFTHHKLNQIKSNHFYCHITTAQVPWWVKFLWACSRQCRKTTDNLHMDRQCKKTTTTIYIWTDSAKKQQTIYIWTDSAKKQQTIYIWTASAKKLHWSIYSAPDSEKKKKKNYIWTVHIYRLYRRQCAKYTYIYSVHIVYYKDTLNYQRHIIHHMGTSALCTLSIHNVVYT